MDLARTFLTILSLSVSQEHKISTSRNGKDKISAGKPFKSADEKGLTLPMSFVKHYNEETGKKLKAKDFIGKEIQLRLLKILLRELEADIKTKIVRIVDDSEDAEESNSYASQTIGRVAQRKWLFTKTVSYMLLS